MQITVTESARQAHARYEAKRRGKTLNMSQPAARPVAKPKPAKAKLASRPAPASGGTVWAVTASLNAHKAAGRTLLTGSQAAAVFNVDVSRWLAVCGFSLAPAPVVLDSGAKRWRVADLEGWASKRCPFVETPTGSVGQQQNQFYRNTFMPRGRVASKELTEQIATRHASRVANHGAK